MKFNKEEIIVFFKQNVKTILFALLTSILIICLILSYINNKSNTNNYNLEQYESSQNNVQKENTVENKKLVFVDIKGAVKKPGVYELSEEKRIKDLIDIAGGLEENADTSQINLSQKVRDQMMIIIPKIGDTVISNEIKSESNKKVININLANKEELMKISGIGETKAKAIIDYRENVDTFKKKEDITKVKGIGKGTFEKIKDEIEV